MRLLTTGTSWSGRIAARTAVLGLLVLALAAQSHAGTITITLDNNIGDYHQYTYTDADGNTHSEYTGPYPVTFSGGSYGAGGAAFVMCYDINLDAYVGASYAGTFVVPTETTEVEAAYLLDKLAKAGGFNADVQSVSGPISMAVWQLTDPSSQNPAPFAQDPAAGPLVTEAQDAYLHGSWTQADAANYLFWVPIPITTTQRFGFLLGEAPSPLTDTMPEPASLPLMAAGLGVVLALRWKR